MLDVNPTGKHRKQRRHRGEGSVPLALHDHRRTRPYACVLSLGVDPTTGRRVRRWFYGVSKSDAEAKRDEARKALARNVRPEGVRMTVADACDRWLDAVRPPATSPSTFDRYEGIVVNHIRPTLGPMRLWALDQAAIRTAMGSWGSNAQRGITLARLRSVLAHAVSEQLVERNEAEFVKPPKTAVREAPAISPADAARILATAEGTRLYPLVVLALGCGLRRGELLGLHWADIDLDGAALTVRWSLRYIPPEWRTAVEKEAAQSTRLRTPKTVRSQRVVPLPPVAVAALRARLAEQETERREAKVWAENDLVFADAAGNSLWPTTVTLQVETLLERAGFAGMRLHDLRAGFATLLAAEGIHPRVVQGLMGHTTMQQSMDYTKVVPADARDAAARMDLALRRTS